MLSERQILIKHWKTPYHRCEQLPSSVVASATGQADNHSCQDQIQIGLVFRSNHNHYYFISDGCMVTVGLASMLCEIGDGKTTQDMIGIMQQMKAMLAHQSYDRAQLQHLTLFRHITQQPSRMPCAQVVITAFTELLSQKKV